MSFELTDKEALAIYDFIANETTDGVICDLARALKTRYYSKKRPDWLFTLCRDQFLAEFPSVAVIDTCVEPFATYTTIITMESMSKGKMWVTETILRPLLLSLLKHCELSKCVPTHYSLYLLPQRNLDDCLGISLYTI